MLDHVATADRPFGLPALITTTVDLPMPPSMNRIWRQRKGGVYIALEYRRWQRDADVITISRRVRIEKIEGAFEATIYLNRDQRRGDCDNRGKCLMDWAQSRSLIANDKDCESLTIKWSDAASAPDGARLVLRELTTPERELRRRVKVGETR